MTDERTTHGRRSTAALATITVLAVLAAAGSFGLLMYQRQVHALEMREQQREIAAQADTSSQEAESLRDQLRQAKAQLAKSQKRLRKATKARDAARRQASKAKADADSAPTVQSPPTSGTDLTPCQRMGRDGVPFSDAYAEWLRSGAPANWDADGDGIPCEQTYGEQTYVP